MLLLDKPFVSELVKENIRAGLFQALDTGNVLPVGELGLLNEKEALNILKNNPGERVHTISENSISWIEDRTGHEYLKEKIYLFKDKHVLREMTADLYPELFYRKVSARQIKDLDAAGLNFPLVIKPNIGFFSMGVHRVSDEESWREICNKISSELEHIQLIYPRAVLDTTEFIIEGAISGEEYAIDAYYDENGTPVLVGVMHHLFGDETDVSDRVYQTSAEIINRHWDMFYEFLKEIGRRSGLKDFSLHAEVRVSEEGKLVPIEINPLRFGAWCTSADLMHHAFGINPYHYYLNNIRPDWEEITGNINDDIFSIIILDNSTGIPGNQIGSFDYAGIRDRFSQVLEFRKIDYREYPIFGILFTRTDHSNRHEIEKILHDDLKNFIKF
jgi:hypothetical protein